MQQIDLQHILKSGLIHLYVLGLASPQERARVEEWKRRYPELHRIIEEVRTGLSQKLASALDARLALASEPPSDR